MKRAKMVSTSPIGSMYSPTIKLRYRSPYLIQKVQRLFCHCITLSKWHATLRYLHVIYTTSKAANIVFNLKDSFFSFHESIRLCTRLSQLINTLQITMSGDLRSHAFHLIR